MTRESLFSSTLGLETLKAHLRKDFKIRSGPVRNRSLRWFETIDGAFGRNDKILVHERNRLFLFEKNCFPDFPLVKSNPMDCPAMVYWRGLPAGAFREETRKVLNLRSAVCGSELHCRQAPIGILNEDRKTVVRLDLCWFDDTVDGWAPSSTAIRVVPVRGYPKESEAIDRFLKSDPSTSIGFPWPGLVDGTGIGKLGYGHGCRLDLPLAETERVGFAANRMIRELLGLMRANEKGIIDDIDTEFLHDYRVSLRKIRSILSLVKGLYANGETSALKQEFADIASRTNLLRDLDVYLLDHDDYIERVPDSLRPGLEQFFVFLQKERTNEHRKLVRYLKSSSYKGTLRSLQERFAEPGKIEPGKNANVSALRLSRSEVLKHYHKLCRIGNKISTFIPANDVHKLRIEAKKLRYLIELFSTLYPKGDVNLLLKRLRQLQNTLGLFNDHAVQQDFLLAFLQRNKGVSIELAASVGGLIGVLNRAQRETLAQVENRFARFNNPKTESLVFRIYKK